MRQRARVAVVVDSAASLPSDLRQQPQMHVVPMHLDFDGKAFLDGRDLSPTEFYRMLRGMRTLPTTSAPSPQGFLEVLRTAAQEAESILCLTVSPEFSASFNSARTAAAQAEHELPDTKVSVLDTETAAGGEALVALAAWRSARDGGALEEVLEQATRVIPRVTLFAYIDTLYYLWRGGRVPRIAHAGTALLRIKPVLEMGKGKVRHIARPRTRRRATQKLLDLTRARAGDGILHASVIHADAEEEAEGLRRRIDSEFECVELFISEFSPVMGSHTGPGLLGVAFWTE